MFFKDTFKRFFDEKLIFIILTISALAYLLLKLLIEADGLIFLFYFSISLLTSLIFRESCLSDEIYFEDKKKLNKNNILSYILSKNLFTIFLTGVLVILVFLLSFLLKYKLVGIKDFFDILILILATLASENIVLLFYNKPIFTEHPKSMIGDKYIGKNYIKSFLPSFFIDLLITLVFERLSLIYLFIFCYFISIIIFYIRVKNRGLYD
ncbi:MULTISPECIES: hypothetical protein [Anaerococcus]|uniref:hypothetical protein n=1 Tax=Anaerococcus TaxID=165779 RepID=UPI00290292A5|nr:hypothetical protein [Anaerococcus vaginalis]MDU1029786.1 hypothetical protein [Anaerococcus vaginalis]